MGEYRRVTEESILRAVSVPQASFYHRGEVKRLDDLKREWKERKNLL